MGPLRSYLLTLCLYIFLLNEFRLPRPVTCEDEQSNQCIPKRAFLALLRLRQARSNLAAYSRVMQDVKNRDDMSHLKALTEEGDDAEVCIPAGMYLDLFKDPALRGHLSVIGRTQKLPDIPGRLFDTADQTDSRDSFSQTQKKRSIATLAKNDDLPISFQVREGNDDDEEKRSTAANEHMDAVLRRILNEETRRAAARALHEYLFPNGDFDWVSFSQDYPLQKRNPDLLSEDIGLPFNRRNIASLARSHELPSGKRNVGSLARDGLLPNSGKRNVASLARTSMLPQNGKRNVASLAREHGLPYYGKRYSGSILGTADLPFPEDENNVFLLARDSDWSNIASKGVPLPANIAFQILHQRGGATDDNADGDMLAKSKSNVKIDSAEKRFKRQIDYSEEYPLPVMQSSNEIDYEDIYEALTGQHQNTEKRFMGRIPQMGPRPTTPPTNRRGR